MELAQCQKMQVQCPPGVGPGSMIQVTAPSGQPFTVQVPSGINPGMVFEVGIPMVTPMAQAAPMQPQMMQVPMQPQMMQAPMQPQMMQAPMQPHMMQAPMQSPMIQQGGSPYDALNSLPRVEVQEKANMVQALTAVIGIEVDMANKYRVLDSNGQEYFFVVETTDFITRNLKRGPCADCVGWDADFLYTLGGAQQKFLHLHRDHSCTCLCFNRPILDVEDVMTGQKIGSIQDPFACCDLTFSLLDPSGQDVLFAKGGCCQPGLFCPLPCGPCATVHFDISDAKSGETLGSIDKKVPSCLKWLTPGADIDNYEVDFQQIQHPQWKALVVVLSIFIDFRYFSETQDPRTIGDSGLIGMINNS